MEVLSTNPLNPFGWNAKVTNEIKIEPPSERDHYLRWNREHVKARLDNGIQAEPSHDHDYGIWVESCLTAMKMNGEVENDVVLPRIIRKVCRDDDVIDRDSDLRDREGYRIFVIRPALMDITLAKASTYRLAGAIYFDRSIDRGTMEKATLCLDTRAGRGWPNTHVLRLLPFMKECVKVLLPLFKNDLHKALIYPVPSAFTYVWRMISKYIDPETVERVHVLEGRCKIVAPPPTEKMQVHIGDEALEQMEAIRINSFTGPELCEH